MAIAEDVPPEIWHEVLVYQDPLDLLRLRLLCHWMQDIVDGSSYAQYLIESFCAGVYDELHAGLPYAERLAVLRRRETAWRTMTPDRIYNIPITVTPSGLYDCTGGTFLLGRNNNPEFMHTSGFSVLHLPSTGDSGERPKWKDFELGMDVVDFGLNVHEHDLNAVITQRHIEGPPPEGHHGLHIMLAKFEVHLRQFSTGEPHPEAAQPVITLREQGLVIQRSHAMVEIAGDLLIVLLFFPFMVGMRLDNIYIINWKTGVTYRHAPFEPHQYKSFVFLDPHTLMLPNLRTFALDIFKIDVESETGAPLEFKRIAVLCLPQKQQGVRMISCQCRSEPNSRSPGSSPVIPPSPSRPFRDSPESAVVLLAMTLMYAPHSTTSLSMIVHRAALLKAAKAAVEGGRDPEKKDGSVAYDFWGLDVTSWFDAGAGWITQSAGNRYVGLTHDTSYTAIRLYDFNPRKVRRLLAQHDSDKPVKENGNTMQVISGMRQMEARTWFVRPIQYGLPHVQSTLEEPCTADGVLIDEENILVVTTDRSTYRIKTVEGLHFG